MVSVRQYEHTSNPPAPVPEPHTAVIFYGVGGSGNVTAVTKHLVVNGKIGLGEVVNGEELAETVLRSAKAEQSKLLELIPSNVIYDSTTQIVWHTKRIKLPMWIRDKRTIKLDVEWPPLLFIADKQQSSLQIFALANNSRPSLNTKIYYAPLMNIYNNHILCQGSARLPEKIGVEGISDCIDSLTNSVFTHVNNPRTIKSKTAVTNQDHIQYWKQNERVKGRVRISELTPAGRLSDFISN